MSLQFDLHPLCTRVREVFSYDPQTGELRRLVKTSSRAKVGSVVGCKDRHGHLRVAFNGKGYAAHRLVWLHMTGQMPQGDVDHINGVRDDNRWSNLRDVPHRVNLQNRKRATAGNKSGFLGVSRRNSSYLARINENGKQICLGSFGSAEEAHSAYLIAKRDLHSGCTL